MIEASDEHAPWWRTALPGYAHRWGWTRILLGIAIGLTIGIGVGLTPEAFHCTADDEQESPGAGIGEVVTDGSEHSGEQGMSLRVSTHPR